MGIFESNMLYYLIISTVICGCFFWIYRRALIQGLEVRKVMDISLYVVIAGFIGARLTHVFYEHPEIYLKNPLWILDFGRGGYVYYGGLITGALTGWFVFKKQKESEPLKYYDLAAPVLSLGYALGRISCLMAGCCYGPEIFNNWGMKIVDRYGTLHYHHPTPLYSTLIELVIFGILIFLEKKPNLKVRLKLNFHGSLFFTWLAMHSLARFFLEFWRADYRGPEFLFSISGWISIVLFLISSLFLSRKSKAA